MLGLQSIDRRIKQIDRWLPERKAVRRQEIQISKDPGTMALGLGFDSDPWQKLVIESAGRVGARMLLNCTRQAGKSTTTALAAVYVAASKPDSLILLVSPSLRQSGELFRKVADWVGKAKIPLVEDNKLSCTMSNGSRIISLPSSEATIRGYSKATLIIEDEASRVDDALYYAIRPMLAIGGGGLILMSTPFGKRGHFYQEWMEGGDQWQRVLVPATDVPRISADFLVQERASLGEWWYSQEYLCEFRDSIDSLFGHEMISAAMDAEVAPLFGATAADVIDGSIKPLFGGE